MNCATCNDSGLSKVDTATIICPDCRGMYESEASYYEDFEADLDFEVEYGVNYGRI